MRRREFIALVGGAVAWPVAAGAQQADRMRRIAGLIGYAKDDPQGQRLVSVFRLALRELGWTEGGNVKSEYRFISGDADRIRTEAVELVRLTPDVILASTTPVLSALLHTTSTIPIVFAQVADPVGLGFVTSLSNPGGNTTGFSSTDDTIYAKQLELLKRLTLGFLEYLS